MKLKAYVCAKCGNSFMYNRKKKLCLKCWGKLSAPKEYTCAYCGKKFERYYSPKIIKARKSRFFCSYSCRSVYLWHKAREKEVV